MHLAADYAALPAERTFGHAPGGRPVTENLTGPATADVPSPFAQPSQWVMLADISPQAKNLYVLLIMHVLDLDKGNRVCWPGMKRLAKLARVKRIDSISAYTKELERIGAVTVRRDRHPAQPLRKQNFYTLKLGSDAPPPGYDGLMIVWEDRTELDPETARHAGTPSEWGSVGGGQPTEATEPHQDGAGEPHRSGAREPHSDGVELEVLDLQVVDLQIKDQNLSLVTVKPTAPAQRVGAAFEDRERDQNSPNLKSNEPKSAIHGLLAKHGVSGDEADALIPAICAAHAVTKDGWFFTADSNGSLPLRIMEARHTLANPPPVPGASGKVQDQAQLAYLEAVGKAEMCPHDEPGGHIPRPGVGTPRCPQCRRAQAPPAPPRREEFMAVASQLAARMGMPDLLAGDNVADQEPVGAGEVNPR